ncbi:DUF6241 domain-containing protein [Paenibacillus sp. Root444D2]|uniref:DUF6241 domain-containing protein n=1 Tax=Paenibacillus sp. Root444D2 TaxID=1736538 RepID=UPI00070E4CC4|nr:DUF6241 domain-containing protein [Paenibacillus sp. Root444D2]KQX53931.1 hypothetical protein ASD40_34670 [Paenibacillus sp. Root444D2]
MKKKFIITVTISALIVGSAFAYVKANNITKEIYNPVMTVSETPKSEAPAAHPIDKVRPFTGMKYGPNQALIAVDDDYLGQIKKMNANGEYMNEVSIIMNLHSMTHQKIKADQIGFSIKMTHEFLDLMIENIEKAPNIEERDNYLALAKKWKASDFTRIVDDHDYLDKRQGGTVGFSTGVNSPEEEAAFVEKWFNKKDATNEPTS